MRIGVIADDLTGANATGVRMSKEGIQTATVVQGTPFPFQAENDALVVDTDSRYSPGTLAQKRVRNSINDLTQWGADLFCKRIDSTMRGNIGAELEALLDRLGESARIVVAPSFPDSGRIVIGGYLLVNDVPLEQTDVAQDPVYPINQSCVPPLISKQTKYSVASLSLSDVLQDQKHIACKVRDLCKDAQIIVCDATTNEQIENIGEAMEAIKEYQFVAADPGPLTAAYAKAVLHSTRPNKRIMLTIGSATQLTGQQLNYVLEKTGAEPIYADPMKLASYSSTWDEEIERVTKQGVRSKDTLLIVTTHHPGHALIDLKSKALAENTSEDALAKRITDALGKITRQIIENADNPIKGCFSSGGDVTASLCAISRAEAIELEEEVLPLAAFGRIKGGYFDSLPLITKGGLVGDKKAIFECIRYLRAKI